nr:CobW family GTP-binding protein [uncultured Pseudomonas sp.]
MLKNIPTHVVAGPLGAGKTSLIGHLLAQKPANERWAVLVNEFGQIGLDAALLHRDEEGVAIAEVAGGCLCCVNGVPFQVGLGRLLRKACPDRLFIEPSGLGHPLQLLHQLSQAPWAGILQLQPLIMVLDASALARGERLAEAQQQALAAAELLIINKADAVDNSQRLAITEQLSSKPAFWTEQGRLAIADLLQFSTGSTYAERVVPLPEDNYPNLAGALWTTSDEPLFAAEKGEGGWSCGWRWHPSQCFEQTCIEQFLSDTPWLRAKGVIHSARGWQSFNGLAGGVLSWQPSEWRKDSRIELIFAHEQPVVALQQAMADCRTQR